MVYKEEMLSTLFSGVCFSVKSAFFLAQPMNKFAYFGPVPLPTFVIYESLLTSTAAFGINFHFHEFISFIT